MIHQYVDYLVREQNVKNIFGKFFVLFCFPTETMLCSFCLDSKPMISCLIRAVMGETVDVGSSVIIIFISGKGVSNT